MAIEKKSDQKHMLKSAPGFVDPIMPAHIVKQQREKMKIFSGDIAPEDDVHYRAMAARDEVLGVFKEMMSNPELSAALPLAYWGTLIKRTNDKEWDRLIEENRVAGILLGSTEGHTAEASQKYRVSLLHRRWKHYTNAQIKRMDQLAPAATEWLAQQDHPLVQELVDTLDEYRARLQDVKKLYAYRRDLPHVSGIALDDKAVFNRAVHGILTDKTKLDMRYGWAMYNEDHATTAELTRNSVHEPKEVEEINPDHNPQIMAMFAWEQTLETFYEAAEALVYNGQKNFPENGVLGSPQTRIIEARVALGDELVKQITHLQTQHIERCDRGEEQLAEQLEPKIDRTASQEAQATQLAQLVEEAHKTWYIEYAMIAREMHRNIMREPCLTEPMKRRLANPLQEYVAVINATTAKHFAPKDFQEKFGNKIALLDESFKARIDQEKQEAAAKKKQRT